MKTGKITFLLLGLIFIMGCISSTEYQQKTNVFNNITFLTEFCNTLGEELDKDIKEKNVSNVCDCIPNTHNKSRICLCECYIDGKIIRSNVILINSNITIEKPVTVNKSQICSILPAGFDKEICELNKELEECLKNCSKIESIYLRQQCNNSCYFNNEIKWAKINVKYEINSSKNV